MGFAPKFGQAFQNLSEHDKAAVVTTVMEAVRNTDRYVPKEWVPQFIERISSSPEELECARDWYRRWQEAGHEAQHLLKTIQQKPPGTLHRG